MSYFIVVLLSFICNADFVWHTDSLEVFDELAKVDVSCDKVALDINAPEFFGFRIDMNPDQGYGSAVGLQYESVGVVPYPNRMLREVNN